MNEDTEVKEIEGRITAAYHLSLVEKLPQFHPMHAAVRYAELGELNIVERRAGILRALEEFREWNGDNGTASAGELEALVADLKTLETRLVTTSQNEEGS